MATEFKILRGPSETLTEDNLRNAEKLVNGYWYLTNDTAEVYVCLDIAGTLTLKKINECDDTSDWDEVRIEDIEARLTALENTSDVETFGYRSGFPEIGESNKLYVAVDEQKSYVWVDTQYLPIGGSSSEYVEPNVIWGGSADEQDPSNDVQDSFEN